MTSPDFNSREHRARAISNRLHGLDQYELEHIDHLELGLSFSGGNLRLRDCPVDEYFDASNLPVLVFDGERLRSNYEALRSAFTREFSRVRVCYAVKACYFRPVLNVLAEAGASFEVMSQWEMQLVRSIGVDAGAICANGVGRTAEFAEELATLRPALTVIDSMSDLLRIEAAHSRQQSILEVLIRVNPASTHNNNFIQAGSKLGTDAGVELDHLVTACVASAAVRVVGLHSHVLSHCADLEQFRQAVRLQVATALDLRKRFGLETVVMDIGGGLESRFLFERSGAQLADFARAAAEEIGRLPSEVELVLEPGRWVVADAAIMLCSVSGEKTNSGRRWLITDVGAAILLPLPELVYHPVPAALGPEWDNFAIGDSTCDPQNVLCASALLPQVRVGDRLALLNCGAYTSVFSSAWSNPLPRMVFSDEGELTEVFGLREQQAFWQALHGFSPSISTRR